MTKSTENNTPIYQCPNCGHELVQGNNYCPSCGQKNSLSRIKLKDLLSDFFAGLFNLDNKIIKTLIAIWVPGKLTRLFFEGKRTGYTEPLRLYLFLSFVVFGIIGLIFNQSSTMDKLGDTLDTKARLRHKKDLLLLDSLVGKIHSRSHSVDFKNGAEALLYLYALRPKDSLATDTLAMELGDLTLDSDVSVTPFTRREQGILENYQQSNDSFNSTKQHARLVFEQETEADSLKINFDWIKKYSGIHSSLAMADLIEMPLDTLYQKYEAQNFFGRLYIAQSQKIVRNPANALFYILGGFSWIAILFIPFMAFFHSLIYIRRKYYYVEHLVFTVHCTSLAFLLFILIRAMIYVGGSELLNLLFLAYPIYILYAMKKYYGQGWAKTLIKWILGQNVAIMIILGIAVLSFLLRMVLY